MPRAKFLTTWEFPPGISNSSSNSTDSPAQEMGLLTPAAEARNSALTLNPSLSSLQASTQGYCHLLCITNPSLGSAHASPGHSNHLHTGSLSSGTLLQAVLHTAASYLFTTFFVTHYSPLKQFSQEAACGASEAGVCRHTATLALSKRGTPVA